MIASVAGQIAAGAASIVLTIAVARTQTAEQMGVFAVTLAVQALFIGIFRSFTGDVFLFSQETYRRSSTRTMMDASTSAVVLMAFLTSVAFLAIGSLISSTAGNTMVVGVIIGVAVLVVPTALQQHLRIVLVAVRRHKAVLITDTVALVAVIAGAILATIREPTVLAFVFVWAIASSVYSLIAILLLALRPSIRPGLGWLAVRWRSGITFATDFAVTAGLAQFIILFVPAVAGVASAAALKGAQTLIMPVTLVTRGAGGPVAAVLVRKIAAGARIEALRLCALFSAFCFFSAAACFLWLLVPVRHLELLLGATAQLARDVVVPTALAMGAVGVATGAGYFLRADGGLRVATGLKITCLPLSLLSVIWGTLASGAVGAQLGFMAGETTRAVLAWGMVRRRQN